MLVKMLVSVREGTSASQEELLLNVIAASTNLTYYSSKVQYAFGHFGFIFRG